MITVVCYLPLSNLIQPLIKWYNPFGDTLASPTLCVHPFLSLLHSLNYSSMFSKFANLQILCAWAKLRRCGPPRHYYCDPISSLTGDCKLTARQQTSFCRAINEPLRILKLHVHSTEKVSSSPRWKHLIELLIFTFKTILGRRVS